MRRNQISSFREMDESKLTRRVWKIRPLLAAEVCASAGSFCTVLDRLCSAVVRRLLDTHSIF
jgi:hypothetical protein